MTYDERILSGLRRVAERQEVDGIEHVGLACSVVSDEAVYFGRQVECGLTDILVVYDGQSCRWVQSVDLLR